MLFIIFTSCVHKKEAPLNDFQKQIKKLVEKSETTLDLFEKIDTIFLHISSDSLDSSPLIKFSSGGFVLANPYLKTIYKFDRNGKVLNHFGADGSGPGEFRSIISFDIDENDNIYVYDHLLSQVTKFDKFGELIYQQKVIKNNQTVRHICALNSKFYLHHAPLDANGYYISVYDSSGFISSFHRADPNYRSYYMRGFLDGGLVSDKKNMTIYEVNCYKCTIHKISKGKESDIGECPENYEKLKKIKATKYEVITDAYLESTIPQNIFIVSNKRLLLQEYLKIDRNNPHGSVRFFQVYDTNGVFLGKVKISEQNLFLDSDGNYLLEYFEPKNFPMMKFKKPYPFIIIYKIRT
ncbi:6-bladed beta-propeller [Candidatus Gracilibacteria bacterium]|nr:6-bladed beta-propeller [Candidatus Gracilibacteria bacterium]